MRLSQVYVGKICQQLNHCFQVTTGQFLFWQKRRNMTLALDVRTTELPPSPEHFKTADKIDLSRASTERLTKTTMYHLGHVVMLDTGERRPVQRVHVGPAGVPAGGGTKFKGYETQAAHDQDTVDHGDAMFYKNGALNQRRKGGKTVANIAWRLYRRDQVADAARQVGRLYAGAGLADVRLDRTAADEGTGPYIAQMIEGMRDMGVEHPEACITGKEDMHTRNPATGRGGVIAHRALMGMRGQDRQSVGIQGAGPVGLYYAADAYQPRKETDRARQVPVYALGDLDSKTQKPAALVTNHPEGLPITYDMVSGILEHPDNDREMQAEGGYKLAALASKIEKQGVQVEIVNQDVLTYDNETRPRVDVLVPAATSNVLGLHNINQVTIKEWVEMGNHVATAELLHRLGEFGVTLHTGKRFNAGGAYVSSLEQERDLARIEAEASGGLWLPISDAVYDDMLHNKMTATTVRDYKIAEAYEVNVEEAVDMVGLAHEAMANNEPFSSKMRGLMEQYA
jgi:glutamate dehydrogenase/leucine dehydrogenase